MLGTEGDGLSSRWLHEADQPYVFGNRVAGSKLDRVYQGKREPDHRTSE